MAKKYICVCGTEFASRQALIGHYANCAEHKADKENRDQEQHAAKEARRQSNGLFVCEECGKEHDGSYGSGKFCSDHCRRVFCSKKRQKSSNGKWKSSPRLELRSPYGTWKCERCNLVFETRAKLQEHNHAEHPIPKGSSWNKGLTAEIDERVRKLSAKASQTLRKGLANGTIKNPTADPKYWTEERREKQRQNAFKNSLGGYHRHGGKGKRGWYKGYWCDSSWKLAWVIYSLEHGVQFTRNTKGFPYVYKGEQHEYHPDFLISDGSYVEIKGWYDEKTVTKHETFISLGYKLNVIDKTKISLYLDYVVSKYGKEFTCLYESRE